MNAPVLAAALVIGCLPALAAEPVTVNYNIAIAGLPVGSATLALKPNGQSTSIAVSGRAGGPMDLGRMSATATVAPGVVTAQSRSGSGKEASEATISSRGAAGDSRFTYEGKSGRGPAKIAMTMAGSRVTALEAAIPDNPRAVRVPVTDAHKAGVVDPLSLVGMLVQPGGTMRPEAICGRKHAVFTGQARFDMAGTPIEDGKAEQGLPQGWRALACRVTLTPISGHRIDKGGNPQPRTANLIFARNGTKTVLWSLSVPAMIGSFTLLADKLQ